MTQLVKIENQSIAVKEYKGQKVVTFKDVDTVHGRPSGTARKRFNDNRRQFGEGVDYYHVKALSEIRTTGCKPNPNGVIVLTETGYLMLVKSLTDDLAWRVQRQLVENYFHSVKPVQQQMQLEEPYQYQYKTWRGEQVVTLRDIARLTDSNLGSLQTLLGRRIAEFRKDEARLLVKDDLRQFRAENPTINMERFGSVYILTAKGTKKLLGLCANNKSGLAVWKKAPAPVPKPVPASKDMEFGGLTPREYVQSEIRALMHFARAIEGLAARALSASNQI